MSTSGDVYTVLEGGGGGQVLQKAKKIKAKRTFLIAKAGML